MRLCSEIIFLWMGGCFFFLGTFFKVFSFFSIFFLFCFGTLLFFVQHLLIHSKIFFYIWGKCEC